MPGRIHYIVWALLLGVWPANLFAGQTLLFFQRGYVSGSTAPATKLTDGAIAGFERRNPGLKVKVVGVPWGREGDLKLRASLLNQEKIDCFRVTNDQLPDFVPAEGNLLSPVDPFLNQADFDDLEPAALDAVRHKGHLMAWPLWSTALAVIGNPRLMRERGIEGPGNAGWTWDEFIAALKKGTYEAAGGVRVYGLTSPARPPLFEWNPILWSHAGPIFLEGEGSGLRLSPKLPDALSKAASLRELGVVPPSFGIDDQPGAQAQFLDGRAVFIMSSPAFIRTLAAKKIDYVILPPPSGDYGRPITTGGLGAFAVVAHPKDPAREKASHALARYLTSAEVADDSPGWYLAPPVRKSVKAFYDDPAYAGLRRVVGMAVYMNPPGGTGFLESTIIPKLQAAMMGEIKPERAIEDIEKAYGRLTLE